MTASDAEVIDLATLKPYDEDTVLASVQKTGRCVIVHEGGTDRAALVRRSLHSSPSVD